MKKLEGNGLWESSRMMLFEHRDTLLDPKDEIENWIKPILDEQKMVEISEVLNRVYNEKTNIVIKIYGNSQPILGHIRKIDLASYRIKVGEEWIELASIIDAEEL